jgi:hypothetical protein
VSRQFCLWYLCGLIHLRPGDLVAVETKDRFHYALLLERIRLFGGHWTFAFYLTSANLLSPTEVLDRTPSGFHAFVDFIWGKREGRITRLARNVGLEPFAGPGLLKQSNTSDPAQATIWFIYDMSFKELKRTPTLSSPERKYPFRSRIDDVIMCDRIDRRWSPECSLERGGT